MYHMNLLRRQAQAVVTTACVLPDTRLPHTPNFIELSVVPSARRAYALCRAAVGMGEWTGFTGADDSGGVCRRRRSRADNIRSYMCLAWMGKNLLPAFKASPRGEALNAGRRLMRCAIYEILRHLIRRFAPPSPQGEGTKKGLSPFSLVFLFRDVYRERLRCALRADAQRFAARAERFKQYAGHAVLLPFLA